MNISIKIYSHGTSIATPVFLLITEFYSIKAFSAFNSFCFTRGALRRVKASSECVVRGTEVCEDIAIIRGRFVTIYGD